MEKLDFVCEKKDKIINILMNKGFSYNNACKILRNKDVRIDGQKINDNLIIEKGNQISVFFNEKKLKEKTFDIIYQDDNIIVLNKPCGIEVEGENSVASLLHCFAVHRLDRNTSGLLVLAKNEDAKIELEKAFKERLLTKKYLAEVVGLANFDGEIKSAYLKKDETKSIVKIFNKKVENSVKIQTIFKTIKSSKFSSIVECTLITGKTHQIRAHLAFLGFPIIGDGKYGKNIDNKKFKAKYQRLHSYYLKFSGLKGVLSYLNNKEFINYPYFYNKDKKN